jgi:hypothetical protein
MVVAFDDLNILGGPVAALNSWIRPAHHHQDAVTPRTATSLETINTATPGSLVDDPKISCLYVEPWVGLWSNNTGLWRHLGRPLSPVAAAQQAGHRSWLGVTIPNCRCTHTSFCLRGGSLR